MVLLGRDELAEACLAKPLLRTGVDVLGPLLGGDADRGVDLDRRGVVEQPELLGLGRLVVLAALVHVHLGLEGVEPIEHRIAAVVHGDEHEVDRQASRLDERAVGRRQIPVQTVGDDDRDERHAARLDRGHRVTDDRLQVRTAAGAGDLVDDLVQLVGAELDLLADLVGVAVHLHDAVLVGDDRRTAGGLDDRCGLGEGGGGVHGAGAVHVDLPVTRDVEPRPIQEEHRLLGEADGLGVSDLAEIHRRCAGSALREVGHLGTCIPCWMM